VHSARAGDEEGRFLVPALPPSQYVVTSAAAGFQTWRQPNVVLTVGQSLELDIVLSLAATGVTR
jgi:hypothetical protein